MAINYASKYAHKIDEKFTRESITSPAVSNDFDFVGVKTVNVYTIPTAPMNDYTVSGTSRYGAPSELENTVQEMTMSKDRSFTFTIDRGTYNDTQMSNAAGAALQRQLREVVVPEIDKYRFEKLVGGAAASSIVTGSVTKNNAYDIFLTGAAALIDANVPLTGTTAFVSSNFYKYIKEDSSFIRNSDMAQDMLVKGQVGMVDGIPVVVVPTSYLPKNTELIITNQAALVSPVKLSEYKIHDNPPGINGWLVEGRVYYDAFVLNNKKNAIYVYKSGN